MKKSSYFVLLLLFLTSCGIHKKSTNSVTLNLLDVYEIPYNMEYKNTIVGGLSGIDYDVKSEMYFTICDDKAEHSYSRFYKFKMDINPQSNKIDTLVFIEVKPLKNSDNQLFENFKNNPLASADPEDIRYNPQTNSLFWTNEGERISGDNTIIFRHPSITEMDLDGNFIRSFELPENLKMQTIERGPRRNGTLESLTFSNDYKSFYTSLEEPLYEDGKPSSPIYGGLSRIYKFDTETLTNTAQFAYRLEPVAYAPEPENAFSVNGITALLYYQKNCLLAVERSYSTGRQACTIKIFKVDLSKATDVSSNSSLILNINFTPVSKQLVLNLDDLGIFVDNIEGITFGPKLANGNTTLLLIADNNFSEKEQNQVFLFEISE